MQTENQATMLPTDLNPVVAHEVQRRRTFAIISHPDAGKTTLTEKLLLFGGCIEEAGAVRGRKTQRAARSDWLELEKQRGISVSSTVLSFDYGDYRVNLLDTPGHHDFSEDTYRTLMAADCAVMVLDLAKGIESQTEKLFRVCELRGIPVITFVNKVDRPGMSPLALLDEIESKFGIRVTPRNWPVGHGSQFRGLIDLPARTVAVFEGRDGARRNTAPSFPLDASDSAVMPPEVLVQAREDVELLEAAGSPFDAAAFLAGKLTPVFFGSALTNWGIEQFLQGFLTLSPPPGNRLCQTGEVPAARSDFAGFVFKIQANLDPRHRDRVAFVRVCAGQFERDMDVLHSRTGRRLRLRRAHQVFGQDRETMDVAFPGDVIGLVNPGEFHLGDTLCVGEPVHYEPLPQFSPDLFAILRCPDVLRRKQFERGLAQLLEEGAIQVFHDPHAARREPILAAVGELQFDVVRFRLESEYNTRTEIQWLPYEVARWITCQAGEPGDVKLSSRARLVHDRLGHPVVLFSSKYDAQFTARDHPDVAFYSVRPDSTGFARTP